MKKLIYVYCLALLTTLSSCGETHVYEVINRTKTIEIQTEIIVKKINGGKRYKIVIIDGCEYICYNDLATNTMGDGGAGGLCHKGNCKNH